MKLLTLVKNCSILTTLHKVGVILLPNKNFHGKGCELQDEQLVKLCKAGNSKAIALLITRYTKIVQQIALSFNVAGAEAEDLIQEGWFGFLNAVKKYKDDKSTSFKTFAITCIQNDIRSAVTGLSRKKHKPLNDFVSLNAQTDDSAIFPLITPDEENPENIFLVKDQAENIHNQIQTLLSDFEKQVLNLYLNGLAYSEIAERYKVSVKSVDNAIQRVRKKFKSVFL